MDCGYVIVLFWTQKLGKIVVVFFGDGGREGASPKIEYCKESNILWD